MNDSQDQLSAVGDVQFAVQSLEMSVDSMRRNAQGTGNGEVRVVLEYPAHELQFTG
jgi:hypothetical protein